MSLRTFFSCCAASCVAVLLAGCGGGVKLCPVTGTVTYKNQPVEGAVVSFRCEAANKVATGTTDAQGRFELTTYQAGKGAVAGTHKATVTKMSAPSGGAGPTSMEDAFKKPSPATQAKSLLPPKYADAARPMLEYTVSPGAANDFKIELTD